MDGPAAAGYCRTVGLASVQAAVQSGDYTLAKGTAARLLPLPLVGDGESALGPRLGGSWS
ncbi:hypothetical protein GCM10020216_037100 [Nonomuraea helvata]